MTSRPVLQFSLTALFILTTVSALALSALLGISRFFGISVGELLWRSLGQFIYSVPMLVVSGLGRSDTLGKGLGRLHELPDQGAMVATLCHSETVTDPKSLGEVLDRAFAAMTSGRPGPAHIQISTNMMGQPCTETPS